MTSSAIYEAVSTSYDFRAKNPTSPELTRKIALALGYKAGDISNVPEEANIGEGCGNPIAIASLKEGETVVDLGCGGGFDSFQASRQIGPSGKVIGIDMSESMIELARRNTKKMQSTNLEFIHTQAHQIPLPSGSVDCIISNCVFNLIPQEHKRLAIEELYRILNPNGRIAISDILLLKPLTEEMKSDPALYSGCIAGSVEVKTMREFLSQAGFVDILLVDKKLDMTVYSDEAVPKSVTPCCAKGGCAQGKESYDKSGRKMLDYDLKEWISSFDIYCHKGDANNALKSEYIAVDRGSGACNGCGPGK